MAGARTKGQRKRAKRSKRDLERAMEAAGMSAVVAPKPGRPRKEGVEREPSGKVSRNPEATKARKESAIRTVVEARARHFGLIPPTMKQIPGETMEEFMARKGAREAMIRAVTPAMMREWTGCAVGQAIADQDDVTDLWKAVGLIRQTRERYLAAIDAPDEHAKAANLMIAPSPDGTEPEARILPSEPLTDEEEADAAIARWEALREALMGVDPLAVRFTVDRICAEVAGADKHPVPKAPVLKILRHVYAQMIAGLEEKS